MGLILTSATIYMQGNANNISYKSITSILSPSNLFKKQFSGLMNHMISFFSPFKSAI